jgi:hypothetical protein
MPVLRAFSIHDDGIVPGHDPFKGGDSLIHAIRAVFHDVFDLFSVDTPVFIGHHQRIFKTGINLDAGKGEAACNGL